MILEKEQKGDIVQRLNFIQTQLDDLQQFDKLDWKSYSTNRDIQRNIERLVENVANAAIDVCKIVLVGESIEMPGSYKDIILKLGEVSILSENQAIKIAEYAKLRNTLAHQYLDLKWEKINSFIQNARADFREFKERISIKIKN